MATLVALGASRGSLVGLVLRCRLALTLAGSIAGALGFLAVGRAIQSQLYEVVPSDPASAAVVIVILVAFSIGACLRPALDALRQAPITILREM